MLSRFSSFAPLSESPPAVDVSRCAPFEVDIEKHRGHDIVSDVCEMFSSIPNSLLDFAGQLSPNGYDPRRDGGTLMRD